MFTKVVELKESLLKDYDELVHKRKYYPKNAKDVLVEKILVDPEYLEIVTVAVKQYVNNQIKESNGDI